jgi:hypothetical protein
MGETEGGGDLRSGKPTYPVQQGPKVSGAGAVNSTVSLQFVRSIGPSRHHKKQRRHPEPAMAIQKSPS